MPAATVAGEPRSLLRHHLRVGRSRTPRRQTPCAWWWARPCHCDPSGACDAGTPITPGGAIVGAFHIGNATTYSELISAGSVDQRSHESSPSPPANYDSCSIRIIGFSHGARDSSDGSGLRSHLVQGAANPDDPPSAQAEAFDYICWTGNGSTPSCYMVVLGSGGSIDNVLQGDQQEGHGAACHVRAGRSQQGGLSARVTLVLVPAQLTARGEVARSVAGGRRRDQRTAAGWAERKLSGVFQQNRIVRTNVADRDRSGLQHATVGVDDLRR